MSRIGKLPIKIPSGVQVDFKDDEILVKGPKGELTQRTVPEVKFEMKDDTCEVHRKNDDKRSRQMHGLYRQLLHNMIVGVSQGFSKTLQLVGVGFRAEEKQNMIGLNLGYSTQFEYLVPEGIEIKVEKQTTVIISGISKHKVGQVASEIRSIRPPEPYKGKGIKYADEVIRRKEGKSGKK